MQIRRSLPGIAAALGLLVAAGCGENQFPGTAATGPGTGVGTATIQGSVSSIAGPLGGVRVILVNRDSTLTDGAGQFRFANLPSSTYTVSLRVPLNHTLAPGDSAVRRVRVGPNAIEPVTWQLVQQGVGP